MRQQIVHSTMRCPTKSGAVFLASVFSMTSIFWHIEETGQMLIKELMDSGISISVGWFRLSWSPKTTLEEQ